MSKRGPPSPTITRAKPKCIIANENTFQSSEATRFHEFASDEPQEDDWIREEVKVTSKKMTINDTLKMENAIRKLGNEAEEEAMEEDDDDDDDEDEVVNYSEDDEDEDEDDEEEEYEDEDDDDEDEDASDGNETDNEAGFADSDDSDVEGEFAFWTPGRNIPHIQTGEPSTYRPSAHRAASASSIDSVSFIDSKLGPKSLRRPRRRPMKIRPGTPELPDSTDFVYSILLPQLADFTLLLHLAGIILHHRQNNATGHLLHGSCLDNPQGYKASRIEAAAGNAYDNSDGPDGHVRGAIDIVKGLERKRQRRKEKFLQKHCNRKQKGHAERKPQPGKGAERMRELGLLMAGKTGVTDPYMMSA
ncbi:hypothetical protein M7I_4928 [Glarea lozoyensis 74030]|uniref:Uncharacterized protein n=1 Tax=Glarea lozoyensis (strain ATCC 74030 / MF5533) TaxID=1104152 RepID=H0EQH7_GLAL7|nr:hypothetical protein M7I_4928 [Glarea lozoyensis 74030]